MTRPRSLAWRHFGGSAFARSTRAERATLADASPNLRANTMILCGVHTTRPSRL